MKMLTRATALLLAISCFAADTAPASAQAVQVPTYLGSNGQHYEAQAHICLKSDGTECPSSSGATTLADGADVTKGAKADPKNCATDTTATTQVAQTKCLIDRVQALITALGSPFQAGGAVGGYTVVASASFTTPSGTSAYSSGQLVANSATAGSVTPLQFTICRVNAGTAMLRRIRLKTPDTGFAGQAVTIKLYRDSPTATNGDHVSWLTTESNYIGSVSITLDQHFSDAEKGVGTPTVGSEINYDCATNSQVIYGLVVANGAITPQGAKLFTAVAEVIEN